MNSVPVTHEELGQTFITALLITGSAQRAEAAVLEAIGATNLSEMSAGTLLEGTVSASLVGHVAENRVDLRDPAISSLPAELRNVLNLPADCRRCFVLRVLLGLPLDVTARMLQTETHQIGELLSIATRTLTLPPDGTTRYECQAAKSQTARTCAKP
jgi:hypothetical protein